MSTLPTKRLLVYVVAGLVVLVVGALALLRMTDGQDDQAVLIDAGDSRGALVGPGRVTEAQAGPLDASSTTTVASLMWVQVAGAVRHPGVYQLATGTRVFQAVLAAGGFTEEADEQVVALATELWDGCRIYIPRFGESASREVQEPMDSSAGLSGGANGGAGTTSLVSLNQASAEQLDTLPGIGPALALQIISYREKLGPFTSIDQLTEVPGIGPSKLEQLRPLIRL